MRTGLRKWAKAARNIRIKSEVRVEGQRLLGPQAWNYRWPCVHWRHLEIREMEGDNSQGGSSGGRTVVCMTRHSGQKHTMVLTNNRKKKKKKKFNNLQLFVGKKIWQEIKKSLPEVLSRSVILM